MMEKINKKELLLSLGRITLSVIFGGYIFFCFFLYFKQESLIFAETKISKEEVEGITNFFKATTEEIKILTPDGVPLHGWLNKEINEDGTPAPLIIYFGGNGEELSHAINDKRLYLGYSLALINYRGYGLSGGVPSEANFFKDSLLIYDRLSKRSDVDKNNIVTMGVSMGSGVATYLASKREVTGVVLVSPFDSLLNIAKSLYPVFPVDYLLKHKFDSISRATILEMPLLIIAGDKDISVPIKNSRLLYTAWGKAIKNNKKEFITIRGASHNNIFLSRQYWIEIDNFLKSLK